MVLDFPFKTRACAYALAVALLAGILVGIVPALRASGGNLSSVDPRNVLNVRLDPAEIGYTNTQGAAVYEQLLAQQAVGPQAFARPAWT